MNDYDGKVIIGCRLDSTQLEKDLKYSEKELQKYEKEAKKLTEAKAKAEIDLQPYEELRQELQQMQNEYRDLQNKSLHIDTSTKEGINSYKEMHAKIAQLTNTMGTYQQEVIDSNVEYEKAKKNLDEINKNIEANSVSQNMLNDKIQETSQKLEQAKKFEEFKEGAKETVGSLQKTMKRFALSLFGIQSMYRLVSKASSAWLSQDTELAEKLQNVWVGLGALVSPILEKISTLMLKALGYLNEFVKALSGGKIDLIAKANTKALEKQTKAQKELNRQTYDFDEIRKQQEASAGVSGGISSGGINIPELDERLVGKLQKLAKILRENKELVIGLGVVLGITFGAFEIAKLVSNIGKLIGSTGAGTGLAGLSGTLGALSTIGVIAVGVSLLYTGLTGRDLVSDIKEIIKNIKDLNAIEDEQQNARKVIFEENLKRVEEINAELEKGKHTDEEINKLEEIKKQNIDKIKEGLQNWKILYSLNEQEIQRVNDALKDDKTTVEDIKKNINDWTPGIESAKSGFKTMFSGIKDAWSEFKKGWSNAFGGSSKGSKAYALGGIVTQPTRALIGEAGYPEAVVPMTGDYLSTLASEIGKYSGGGGGNVNVYLDGRLIQREMAKTSDNKRFNTNGG